jgi:hypothetical protein
MFQGEGMNWDFLNALELGLIDVKASMTKGIPSGKFKGKQSTLVRS